MMFICLTCCLFITVHSQTANEQSATQTLVQPQLVRFFTQAKYVTSVNFII